ncbi:terpene synthase family protein [Streptomyces sp. NBC_01565]|uniref:terpene synthase family protein n=1 Tax=Streptomyces sp. NBC_01565 TaxID=2975881 RepID=UPI00224F2E06|nr:terpene synthase family protein [Streptomyces sp. NBC_01565]MCX4546943.1 terpene synthase family protein [Streptomyces sp. NBC_01565]
MRGTPGDMEAYLQVRRGIAGTDLPLSLGERAAGIHVPAAAFHSPQLRIMRQAAIDVTFMCNDVYSLEKEEARAGAETADVRIYVEIMGTWMSGYHAWQTQTRRYTTAPHILPPTGPGYFDQVLQP